MAISQRAVGAWAAVNATTQTVTLPTHATGDMLIVRAVCKPFSATLTMATSGWAAVAAQNTNGSTANGVGVGSMAFRAFWKIAESASEPNPVVDWGTTAAPGAAVAVSYQKGGSESWVTPTGDGGGDTTARTSQTSTIDTHVPVVSGDLVDFYRGQCDDSGALTVPTITQTGVTFAAVVEYPATAIASGTSNDIAADGGYRLATAGTSSAADVVTGTSAASEQHGAWMTRLRVQSVTTVEGSFTADAIIKKTISGSVTADAVIKKTQTGSFTADAIVFKTSTPTPTFTIDALIVQPIWVDTFTRTVAAGGGTPDIGASYEVVLPANNPGSVDGSVAHLPADPQRWLGGRGMTSGVVQVDFLMSAAPFQFQIDVGRYALVINNSDGFGLGLFGQTESVFFNPTPSNGIWYTVKGWGGDGFGRIKMWEVGQPEPDWGASGATTPYTATIPAWIKNADGAIDIDNLSVRTSAGPSWTKGQFTADAVIQKTQTGSFSIDATLAVLVAGSFTADAVIKRTMAGTFTADAVVFKTAAASFTADAVVKATSVGSFTADAVIKSTVAGSLTADAVIKSTVAGSHTVDAVVRRLDQPGSYTIDAVIRSTQTAGATADAVIKSTQSNTFSTDAVLKAERSVTFTGDAVIRAVASGSGVLDAVILKTMTAGITADAVIQAPRTVGVTADAVILSPRTAVFSADAVLRSTISAATTVDAVVKATTTSSFTADAVLSRTQTASFTADAIVLRTSVAGFGVDAFISAPGQGAGAFTINAVIKRTLAGSFSVDAILLRSEQASFAVDAFIAAPQLAFFGVDAVIRAERTASFTAAAILLRTSGVTFDADAIIRATASNSFSVDAEILGLTTFTIDAWILGINQFGFTISAVITKLRPDLLEATLDVASLGATIAAASIGAQIGSSPIGSTLTAQAIAATVATASLGAALGEGNPSFTVDAVIVP